MTMRSDTRLDCPVFHWVGQPWTSCYNCGRPVWEHIYHPPYGDQPVLFRVKVWYADMQCWRWADVGSYIDRSDLTGPAVRAHREAETPPAPVG